MIEAIASKSAGMFRVSSVNQTWFYDYGEVKQILEISKNNCHLFRVVFQDKVVDIYDIEFVIRNNE